MLYLFIGILIFFIPNLTYHILCIGQECWAEFSVSRVAFSLSRARSNLGGVSLLGPKALRCIDGIPLRRYFMLPHVGSKSSAHCLLETSSVLHGSESMEALSKWRLENLYSSGAWFTFWNQDSEFEINTATSSSKSEFDLIAAIDLSISRQAGFLYFTILQPCYWITTLFAV